MVQLERPRVEGGGDEEQALIGVLGCAPMMPRVRRSAALLTLLAAVGCGVSGEPAPSRAARAPGVSQGEVAAVTAAVAHTDARLGAPSFLWLTRAPEAAPFADAADAARTTLRALQRPLHLSRAALGAVTEPVVHDLGRGAILAKVAQRVRGREVFRGEASLVLTRALEPVALTGSLAPSLDGSDAPFVVTPEKALAFAYRAATGAELPQDTASAATLASSAGEADTRAFVGHPFSGPVRVKEVYYPSRDGVVPAYRVELLLVSGRARSVVVSAIDGAVLFTNDLVRNEQLEIRTWASAETLVPMDGPQGNAFVPHPTGRPDATKPGAVAPQLVRLQNFPFSKGDPWLPNGATETRGNNVDAYADLTTPNGFTTATRDARANASGVGALGPVFDWTYDTSASPGATAESIKGSVNHLFYVTNFLHDWFYDSGFDEKSGNHQQDNFGRGGKGSDRLLIEGQDYSGRNNANAATPADGVSPRIQMYVFAGKTTSSLDVETPATLAGSRTVGSAGAFGKDKFVTRGDVALAVDGAGADPNDACEALGNTAAVTGKIVLVHRGTCSFVEKATRVQAAGGIGILVANVASSVSPTSAPYMGGQASDIDIPALSLAVVDGQALEAAIPQGVAVTMRREGTSDLDGGLDTAIVAHEWGHVLSNRLVGNADGLTTNQAGGLGEGWGDFTAQLVMVRADDVTTPQGANWNGVYPTGTHATSGSGDDSYFGIRRQPYSSDMTKNALTFKHISDGVPLPRNVPTSFGEDGGNNSEVHATGEVWAVMLWEAYSNLLRDPRYTFQAAQDRMKRYLVQSLKATPVDPTLLEARDALIAVAYASDEGDFQAFWRAFAKRGAGVGATGPDKSSVDNKGAKESFLVGGDLQIVSAVLTDDVVSCDRDGILDADETGSIEVTLRNSGATTLDKVDAKVTTKSPGLELADGGALAFPALKPFAVAKARVRVVARGSRPIEKVALDVALTDPALAVPRTITTTVTGVRDADEVEDSATTDDVQTSNTSWVVSGKDTTGTSVKWRRVKEGDSQFWSIPNAGEPSDHLLTSAPFAVKEDSFGLTFRHRWAFEFSTERRSDFDGGVVEISLNGGAKWEDISAYAVINYNVTFVDDPRGTNPLKGRKGFGRISEGYPAWREEVLKVRTGAVDDVRVRFRAGADDNTAEAGWDIDDIALTGVATKPFWSFTAHRDACDAEGPKANAGPGKTVGAKEAVKLEGSATHPKGLPLTYRWAQIEGPTVALSGDTTPTLAFTAPDTLGETKLAFALRADDGALLSSASRVDVTVRAEPPVAVSLSGGCSAGPAGQGGGGVAGSLALSLALALVRRRRGAVV